MSTRRCQPGTVRELVYSYRTTTTPDQEGAPAAALLQIRDATQAATFASALIGQEAVEHTAILALDARHRVISWHRVSMGSMSGATVHPREIFHVLVRERAAGWIFCHNHPSGDAEPSPDDVSLSRRLKQAGELMGIALLDSVIVTSGGAWASLRDRGMLS